MEDADLDAQEGSGKSMTPEELQKLLEQMEQLEQNMDQLGSKLREMDAKKKLQGKLKMLGMRLSKAQGYLAGNLNSPFASPGGQKPGTGSSESRRKERDALVDNGQNTQLKGIKGIGPSQTQIEEANEGSAISSRQAEEVERSFAKQLEAFVQREDVPEDVKDGVRDYFTKIHQPEDKTNEINELMSPTRSVIETEKAAEHFRKTFNEIQEEISKFIVGQENVIEHVLIAILAGGHVLLEGVPGLGKTALVTTISKALDLKFQRVQFTPGPLACRHRGDADPC